jgi:hypothetical protein
MKEKLEKEQWIRSLKKSVQQAATINNNNRENRYNTSQRAEGSKRNKASLKGYIVSKERFKILECETQPKA